MGKAELNAYITYLEGLNTETSAGSWRDAFDQNRSYDKDNDRFFYDKSKEKLVYNKKEGDDYIFKIDTNRSCNLLLKMMKELTLDQIDHEQSNEKFFMEMMRLSGKDMFYNSNKLDFSNTYAGHVQNFFKQTLLPQVITNTEKAMGDMLKHIWLCVCV